MSASPPARSLACESLAGTDAGRLFLSFWMGGYEGADHVNSAGQALSMNDSNQHWQRLREDYALLADFGIRTVRESIGWRVTDAQGAAGWRRLQTQAEEAQAAGLEVIWTVMHYGWPAGLDLLSPTFVDRLADFSAQVARRLRAVSSQRRYYQPVNEISFLAWALSCTGMMQHATASPAWLDGVAVKRQLVRAALRACDAIADVDPGARFMHSDPLIDVVPPEAADSQAALGAQQASSAALEAWDMLCGRRDPELGGAPHYLDVVGINYYHDNHWEWGTGRRLDWQPRDPRRTPFAALLAPVCQRYQRPVLVAETSHVGDWRALWLDDLASQVLACRQQGLPIEGVCLYPILDRHDWSDGAHWHHSGLWDVDGADCKLMNGMAGPVSSVHQAMARRLCHPYAERLRYWQQRLPRQAPLQPPLTRPRRQQFAPGLP